jgi:Protein of unknown function (DUF3987)
MAVNGSSTDSSLSNSDGYTIRPLPENAPKVRAARVFPHPLQGWDPFPRASAYQPGPEWPPEPASARQRPDRSFAIRSQEEPEPGWPEPMQPAAFHGLAGEFVSLVLPNTEADPAALLITFLVGIGCMIGRASRYQIAATRHGVNLFSVIVGETSKARKGTATDGALEVLERVDADFLATRMRCGLSSGEGLIQAVRDAREEDVPIKQKDGTPLRFERQLVDSGELDKRLLVVETEFGSVLQQNGREGSILSTVLRQAWDGKPLSIVSRSNKDSCQEPHISLIGNVTSEELQRLLTTTDRANGFGNRILWCCARRSKLLPYGGRPLDEARLDALAGRLREAVEAARAMGPVEFDDEAFHAWANVYTMLSQGAKGLFGSMTARAEAQTLRLAMLYALLDRSRLIRLEHLRAAQEVWGYCEESVRFIFGDALGDETADAILRMLKNAPQGMTQTEINRSFGSHKSAAEMARALTLLQQKGKLKAEQESTGGAKVTRWSLCES